MINYNNWMINMNTIHKMSIYVVLIAILALVPNVSATGIMDGNNWTGIDSILDSYGFSYLKNNSVLITALQSNDTVDRTYVNDTFLPIATYSGDFPNTTIVDKLDISTYAGNFPNSSLINYLLIATYAGNFPNSSLINYLLVSTYGTNFPNNTVAGNLDNWNATYNATYATGEGGFTLTNGTNDIAVGTTNTKYWFSSGIVTALSLSAVENGNFNLSVNNTATGCLNYITLSSAQNNMTSGLNCVYNAGDRMNFTVISNSGIHQVSVGAKYTKTS